MATGTGQSTKLPRFQPGVSLKKQLTADRLNAILDTIEANRLNYGTGYLVSARGPGGVVLRIPRVKKKTVIGQFQLIDATTYTSDGTPTYKVRIAYGIVISPGYVPDMDDPVILPDGMSANDTPVYTLDVSASGTVMLQVTTDSDTYLVTTDAMPTLFIDTDGSTSDSEFSGNLPIGGVTVDDTHKRLILEQNIFGPVGYINALGIHVWY